MQDAVKARIVMGDFLGKAQAVIRRAGCQIQRKPTRLTTFLRDRLRDPIQFLFIAAKQDDACTVAGIG